MVRLILGVVLCLANLSAFADTPPATTVKAKTYDAAGNGITSTVITGKQALDVNVANTITATVSGTVPISAAALPLPAGASTAALQSALNTLLGSPFQAGGSIGNSSFGISGTLPAFASTPTFNLGTLNGAATNAAQVTAQASLTSIDSKLTSPLAVTGTFFQATQPVSAASLPLPAGAATSALQTSGNVSLSSIDSKLTSPLSVTQSGIWTTGRTWSLLNSTDSVNAVQSGAYNITNISGTVSLPTGAATSANQTTANTSLSTIATNTGKTPINLTGSGSSAGSTVSTVATLTAPSNAIGFVLMNLDVSTANIRWAVGRTASTTLGQQLQPGRDTGFVPIGANVSIIAESGTQTYDVQWIAQ